MRERDAVSKWDEWDGEQDVEDDGRDVQDVAKEKAEPLGKVSAREALG